ncbi:MAG TPA: zf-HC2 domain-containing protein [bacterium]|nr:zf-HC2 domain-containing protein [bacterium]
MTPQQPRHAALRKDCGQIAVDLSAYFDGELAGRSKAAVELHLSTCEACRKRLAGMAQIHHALNTLADPTSQRRGSVLELLKSKLDQAEPADTDSQHMC